MKKLILTLIGVTALFTLLLNVNNREVFSDIAITVVNEDGSAVENRDFVARFFNPPGEEIDVYTDYSGQMVIDDERVGDKVSLKNDDLSAEWVEIKQDGTVVKCRVDHKFPR